MSKNKAARLIDLCIVAALAVAWVCDSHTPFIPFGVIILSVITTIAVFVAYRYREQK